MSGRLMRGEVRVGARAGARSRALNRKRLMRGVYGGDFQGGFRGRLSGAVVSGGGGCVEGEAQFCVFDVLEGA